MTESPLPPPIDLSLLPRELEGQWVLVRVTESGQEIVSSGGNIGEVVRGHPRTDEYLLTRVPTAYSTHVVRDHG